ncbi:MAG: hypothetical protein D6E12_15770 [Desulfovibrio sp.]|nr:MAG: hypothetical protein D6E12_15770 [Desulfovibrio sp.]
MPLKQILFVLLTITMLGLAACGDDTGSADESGSTSESASASESSSADEAEAESASSAPSSPADVADAIVSIYNEGLDAVAGMADNPPPLAEAKSQLEALKEDMISRLVELGGIKQSMSDTDKAQVNSALTSAFMRIDPGKFEQFSQVIEHYRAEDNDFANFLSSFNIITQYADYDLLKEQEPEEAARLGIE